LHTSLSAPCRSRTWPPSVWQRLTVRAGSKGPHVYKRAAARVVANRDQGSGPKLWLVARRSPSDPTEFAYYARTGYIVGVVRDAPARAWPARPQKLL